MPLYRPSHLRAQGIRAKKSFSQNFLIDQNVIAKIGREAEVAEGDLICEIGPGPGAITEYLLGKGAKVFAIEIDKELAKGLEELVEREPNLTLFCADALEFSYDQLFPKGAKGKVVASLPYQITTPILDKIIRRHDLFSSLTLVVQKEVAERMVAKPNTSEYSHLTLFASAYAAVTYRFTIKPNSFYPAPKVHSAVIRLDLHPFPFPHDPASFFAMTRAAFGKKRKMLRASLKELYASEVVERALQEMGLPVSARPQELSLMAFGTLFSKLPPPKEQQRDET